MHKTPHPDPQELPYIKNTLEQCDLHYLLSNCGNDKLDTYLVTKGSIF